MLGAVLVRRNSDQERREGDEEGHWCYVIATREGVGLDLSKAVYG